MRVILVLDFPVSDATHPANIACSPRLAFRG